jgi:succinate dehydrogenase / fumarate reductase, flavoprotein subunit
MATIDSKIPEGALAEKWTNYKAHQKLVNPANKRRLDIIVVGTGLAGASAAASLGALGFKVLNFCIQDSPRRAHSIAAQGGINAAKNYQNDGDSVYRLFYDTIKGGDYRAREANVYRLAEVSNAIIDQCVAQGVPFAREYGGLLDNRSFGGAQVSRTFYARGQTGQQLLLGAYSALSREVQRGNVKLYTRYEMLDVVLIKDNEGVERARGIIARNLVTGKIERFAAHAVVIGTGGYGNTYFLSTNAMASNGSAAMQVYRKGAYFANPCFAQIHPTCIPVHGDKQSKLTLMSESLRNDGRIWVPKKLEDAKALQAGTKKPTDIPASYIRELVIVTKRFTLRSLVFFTEVTTTRFLTVQCIVSHQLTDFDEISQADCLFKFHIQFISFTRNAKVAPEGLSYFFQFSQSSSQRFLGTSHTYEVPHDVTQFLVNRVY